MNQYFNIKRFLNYARYNFLINRKLYLLGFAGVIVGLFLVTLLFGYQHNLTNKTNWGTFFSASMAIILLPIIGHAFPALRKKETSITNYMLPASIFEKFSFEFVMKIIIIPALFLLLFPVISNSAMRMAEFIHTSANPDRAFEYADFTYKLLFENFNNNTDVPKVLIGIILMTASIALSGAAAIAKYPLVKTTIFIGLIFLIVLGYFYTMFEFFKLDSGFEYTYNQLFPKEEHEPTLLHIAFTITTLSSLSYAYLKLKEREV
ncbi:hypothetical protein [Labilibacter marinus]|uniref:hypothetical protein n=1 Tax=Labilibacter marinus TaxID=1477105 RepID=UPI00094F4D8B|nr:hypothetical protein [Labilibacter marinus]